VPPLEAAILYRVLAPPFPMRSPFDLPVWLLIAGLAAADLVLLSGPIHPSWEGD
jgi:hypothetical protein